MSESTTIWCNAAFPAEAEQTLTRDLAPYRLVISEKASRSNLNAGGVDPLLAQASIAFGQPDPQQLIELPNVKWVHISSAGYTRYDTDEFRAAMKLRGGIVTNSSTVFYEPCAEHALAMMLALARQLPMALDNQRGVRGWPLHEIRSKSPLLRGQSILIYGFGTIARRLVELLQPFGMQMTGVRRKPAGDEAIPMVSIEQADSLLGTVDHVMNILPASSSTDGFFNARRFSHFGCHTLFYNIGRGATVDQPAMIEALQNKQFAGAYLDVMTPEPLPADHPLWTTSNCWITPHVAGGYNDEAMGLVRHFRENLARYSKREKMNDVLWGSDGVK